MTPPILAHAGPLLARYQAIFCDVWGVMHNGRTAYAESGDALARFRGQGGTVVLVSNAPVPAAGVERVLEQTGVRRDAWDAIVSSGDIALAHIAEKGYRRLHRIGPGQPRQHAVYAPAGLRYAARGGRCHRLHRPGRRDQSFGRNLPPADRGRRCARPARSCAPIPISSSTWATSAICVRAASPPNTSAAAAPCSGQASRTHPPTVRHLSAPATLRGAEPERARILAIGDAIRTDLAAAQGMGIDALFIASGIHNDEVLVDGDDSTRTSSRPCSHPRDPARRRRHDAAQVVVPCAAESAPAEMTAATSLRLGRPWPLASNPIHLPHHVKTTVSLD